MCNARECPFINEMGYCKVTACIRRDLADKHNTYYSSNSTTALPPVFPVNRWTKDCESEET